MKKSMTIVLAFFLTFNLTSCAQNETKKAEQIQKRAFEILKEMDSLSYDHYLNKYIFLEDYKTLARNADIDDGYRNEILSLTKDEWDYFREKEYTNFSEIASSNEIIWKKIEYVDFKYDIKNELGFNWLDGTIYFKHKDQLFETRIYSIYDGKAYQIFGLKM